MEAYIYWGDGSKSFGDEYPHPLWIYTPVNDARSYLITSVFNQFQDALNFNDNKWLSYGKKGRVQCPYKTVRLPATRYSELIVDRFR